jgi:hypothetical protein
MPDITFSFRGGPNDGETLEYHDVDIPQPPAIRVAIEGSDNARFAQYTQDAGGNGTVYTFVGVGEFVDGQFDLDTPTWTPAA